MIWLPDRELLEPKIFPFLGGGGPTGGTVVISENSGSTFSSVPNGRIVDYSPNTNYAGEVSFWIATFEQNVIRFDGLSDSLLSGKTITAAELRFATPYDKSATTDIAVARLSTAFSEATVTWNNVGSSTNIGTFNYLGSGNIVITASWIVSYCQDIVSGTYPNNGLRLSASSGYALTTSSEGADGSRPSLTVTYS